MWNTILHTNFAGPQAHEATETTEASPAQLRELLDSLPAATWIVDLAGRYLHVSRAFAKLVGHKAADCLGMTIDEIMPASMAGAFTQRHEQALAACAPKRFEQIWPIAGEPRWFEVRLSCLHDEYQQITGIAGHAQDITLHIEQQESARAIRNDLEKRVMHRTHQLSLINDELEAFSYSVSHDLRAPLRQIAGFAALLESHHHNTLDEPGRQYLQQITDSSQRMDGLISDLLQLARINQGGLVKARVELTGIAKQACNVLRSEDPSHAVELDLPPPVNAQCDGGLLYIVLANLLSNAWKFTRKRSHPRIQFGHFARNDYTVYYVRDNGAGFDAANAGRLFGAFQRFHRSQDFPGVGIGLATVKRIISRHGGQIWAESAPDQGATFYFTLEPTF